MEWHKSIKQASVAWTCYWSGCLSDSKQPFRIEYKRKLEEWTDLYGTSNIPQLFMFFSYSVIKSACLKNFSKIAYYVNIVMLIQDIALWVSLGKGKVCCLSGLCYLINSNKEIRVELTMWLQYVLKGLGTLWCIHADNLE